MDQQARESYIESQITTATPQKLRLMLIEGALRFARQTNRHWEAGDNERALESIIRCRKIVSQLLSSVRIDESELTKRVAGLYLFVFQQLTEAQLRRDVSLVREAIGVLEIERETWRQLCDELPHTIAQPPRNVDGDPGESTPPAFTCLDADLPSSGISFDA